METKRVEEAGAPAAGGAARDDPRRRDGPADGRMFSQNPPQSCLAAEPPLERAYRKAELWLLDLVTSPLTNGTPEPESRFRPERQYCQLDLK
ncbi:hypothetical protein OYC64_015508 [Pagothenia borchgrevinki]|uniref:Uncharacterized protein n=1 Tax=Pagothenia borchgrevinki TaxID=8213 RepID=A0ABD2HFN6_PAGBO